jgi:uracil-DNA glycosylase family 4
LKESLVSLHREIWDCKKCLGILDADRIIPRSGFPPKGKYRVVVVGAEPGINALNEGRIKPENYKALYAPGVGNKNKARLIFEHLKTAGADWNEFFFTNSVKCPAKSGSQSKRCWMNCGDYLRRQIKVIRPKLVVVMGNGAKNLGLRKAKKDETYRTDLFGFSALVMTHPLGARGDYLRQVAEEIKKAIKK